MAVMPFFNIDCMLAIFFEIRSHFCSRLGHIFSENVKPKCNLQFSSFMLCRIGRSKFLTPVYSVCDPDFSEDLNPEMERRHREPSDLR